MPLQIFTGISGESQMQMDLLLCLLTDLNVHANCDFDAGVKGAFICILFYFIFCENDNETDIFLCELLFFL